MRSYCKIGLVLVFSTLLIKPLAAAPAGTPGRMSFSISTSGRRLVMRYLGHRKTYKLVRGVSYPLLSPNGRQAVYVMEKPYCPHSVNMTDNTPNSLWLLDAATGKNTKIAATNETAKGKEVIGGIQESTFSVDGTQLYFSSAGIGDEDTIHAVDLATRRIRYVCDGGSVRVIRSGPYQNDLIVYAQTFKANGDVTPGRNWLISPEGLRIKPWGSEKDGADTQ